MSTAIYDIEEAEAALPELVRRAAAGEEIVIAQAGEPLVKMVPVEGSRAGRKPGAWVGRIRISEDFDAPLPPDLRAAFGHRDDEES